MILGPVRGVTVLITFTGTVFDPHGDEKVTLPSLFLTLTLKLATLDPETSLNSGVTVIRVDGRAVIVAAPLKLSS